MVAQGQTGFISAEEYVDIVQRSEYADMSVDLVEGELVIMPKPGGQHGVVTFEVGRQIGNHVKANRLGWVTAAETGYILERNPDGRDTVRGLDVGFVRMERAPDGLPVGLVPFAPDMTVEVISPTNEAADMNKKVLQLLAAGTQLVWVIYPETRTVMVHQPDRVAMLGADGTLDGGDVLPGFSLPVAALFED